MKKPRCRACGPSRNIWARQCPNPAKTTRSIFGITIPVCGVHAASLRVDEYRPDPNSRYERPVETEVNR